MYVPYFDQEKLINLGEASGKTLSFVCHRAVDCLKEPGRKCNHIKLLA